MRLTNDQANALRDVAESGNSERVLAQMALREHGLIERSHASKGRWVFKLTERGAKALRDQDLQ